MNKTKSKTAAQKKKEAADRKKHNDRIIEEYGLKK